MRVAFYPESGTLACHTIEHIATHTGHHRRFRCAASLLWALRSSNWDRFVVGWKLAENKPLLLAK
jgi:hypothetical protein